MENKQVIKKLDTIIELLTKIGVKMDKLNEMIEKQEKQTEALMDPKEVIKRTIEIQKELQKEVSKHRPMDSGQYT